PADTPLTAAQLGLTQNNLEVVFDLEAVQPSTTPGDQRIMVETDEDGIGPLRFEFGDAVRATAVQVQLKDRVFNPPQSIVGGQISWVGNDTSKAPVMPNLIAQIVPDLSQSAGARAQWYLRA